MTPGTHLSDSLTHVQFVQIIFPFFVGSTMTAWVRETHKRLWHVFHQFWCYHRSWTTLAYSWGQKGYFRFCWVDSFLRSTFVPEALVVGVRTTSHWTVFRLRLPPAMQDLSTLVYYDSGEKRRKHLKCFYYRMRRWTQHLSPLLSPLYKS